MLLMPCLLLLTGCAQPADAGDFPRSLQARATLATVRLENPARKTHGSGVMVGRTGGIVYVLTAYHVVDGAGEIDVATFSEKSFPKPQRIHRSGKVIAKWADPRDLALVRFVSDEKSLPFAPICPVDEIPRNDRLTAIGVGCGKDDAPECSEPQAVSRKKVRIKTDAESAYFWEWPGAVAKGKSGGPLLDKHGRVVGICSGTGDGKGYFTHIEEIHRFLKSNAFLWLAEPDDAEPVRK